MEKMQTALAPSWGKHVSNTCGCNLLAGQMNLGGNAVFTKQRDEHIGISAGSSLVPGDGDHLIDWPIHSRQSVTQSTVTFADDTLLMVSNLICPQVPFLGI